MCLQAGDLEFRSWFAEDLPWKGNGYPPVFFSHFGLTCRSMRFLAGDQTRLNNTFTPPALVCMDSCLANTAALMTWVSSTWGLYWSPLIQREAKSWAPKNFVWPLPPEVVSLNLLITCLETFLHGSWCLKQAAFSLTWELLLMIIGYMQSLSTEQERI